MKTIIFECLKIHLLRILQEKNLNDKNLNSDFKRSIIIKIIEDQ